MSIAITLQQCVNVDYMRMYSHSNEYCLPLVYGECDDVRVTMVSGYYANIYSEKIKKKKTLEDICWDTNGGVRICFFHIRVKKGKPFHFYQDEFNVCKKRCL
jgi:hypothetical protein